MAVTLYDLAGAGDERFSPYCWRARMALAHKGIDVATSPVNFVDIPTVAGGEFQSLPVIDDNGTRLSDSFAIAEYLEKTFYDAPTLFGSQEGVDYARFIQAWANSVLNSSIVRMVIVDVHDMLTPEDQNYFRNSREKRFGKTLEQVQEGREAQREDFRASLTPVRLILASQPYLGGDEPKYMDYILFGTLQWANIASPFKLLEDTDPINDWFERCLDLHGAIGRAAQT